MKKKSSVKNTLKIINKIQKIRSKNNVNWMDVLRLSVKHAPEETIKLLKKINSKDSQISKLYKKI